MKKRKINEELYNDINYELLCEINKILKENNNDVKYLINYCKDYNYIIFNHIIDNLKKYIIEKVNEGNDIILDSKYDINSLNEDEIIKIINNSLNRILEAIIINTKYNKNDFKEKSSFTIMGLKPFAFVWANVIALFEAFDSKKK